MPHYTSDSQKIYFTIRGQRRDNQKCAILIHGAGGSHLDWPPQLRAIDGWTVCAIDLPGHGRSELPGRSTIDGYSHDVKALMDTAEVEQAIIVGHSMGGAIALRLALSFPLNVAGLVLTSTGARLKVDPAIKDFMEADFASVANLITRAAWSESAPEAIVSKGRDLLLRADPSVVQGDFEACDAFDVMEELSNIDVPSLVIVGSEDRMTPVKFSSYLAGQIPDAELVVIEGGGHMLALELSDIVYENVSRFMNSLPIAGCDQQ